MVECCQNPTQRPSALSPPNTCAQAANLQFKDSAQLKQKSIPLSELKPISHFKVT